MTFELRFLLISIAILTLAYFLWKIRKNRLQINYTIFWSLFSVILVFISIFPGVGSYISGLLGFKSTVNMILVTIIFVLILRLFSITCKLSHMNYQIDELTYRIALNEKEAQNSRPPFVKDITPADEPEGIRTSPLNFR